MKNDRNAAAQPGRAEQSSYARARKAVTADRDEQVYAKKRAMNARKRDSIARRTFDPAPPTDEDWTVASEVNDGLVRVPAPAELGEVLEGLVRRRGWTRAVASARLTDTWPEIVGELLAEHCEPVSLQRTTLTVRADSPTWATQVKYLGRQITDRANAMLGSRQVVSMVVTVGALRRPGGIAPPQDS